MDNPTKKLILDGLVVYHTTECTMQDAFKSIEGMSSSQYYRKKEANPDEIERLNRQALVLAQGKLNADYAAYQARSLVQSKEIQTRAAEAILEALPRLAQMAKGESITVPGEEGEDRVITVYPRDSTEAMFRLQQLARGGILPEHVSGPVAEVTPPLPLLPAAVSPRFKSLTAESVDGTRVTLTVEPPDVVDGAFVEVD